MYNAPSEQAYHALVFTIPFSQNPTPLTRNFSLTVKVKVTVGSLFVTCISFQSSQSLKQRVFEIK